MWCVHFLGMHFLASMATTHQSFLELDPRLVCTLILSPKEHGAKHHTTDFGIKSFTLTEKVIIVSQQIETIFQTRKQVNHFI